MTFALLLVLAQAHVQKVACVGDSITFGIGVQDRDHDSYPAQLQQLLGPKYQVGNFGNSGKAVTKAHPWTYWKVPEFQSAKDFQPDIVIITLGTNDAMPRFWPAVRDDFVPDLKDMVGVFRALKSHPKVYVAVAPPVFNEERHQNFEEETASLVRQAARECGAPLIDFHHALEGQASLFPDQLHPNVEGAYKMALTAYFALGDTSGLKAGWKVVKADSEQAGEGPAKDAIDGDPDTYWHTQYDPKTDRYPHELVIDMGKETTLSALRETPRQDGGVNGRVKGYEVYMSDSPTSWGEPVAKGTLPDSAQPTFIEFAHPASGRYLRFVALSEQNGGPWTSIAELDPVPGR